jgi:hypothetical protein
VEVGSAREDNTQIATSFEAGGGVFSRGDESLG